MIEVRCCHSMAAAEPYREAIDALNLASIRPDPFSTFEFYEHCLQEASRDIGFGNLRLWFVLAFSGSELVGYAALKQCTHLVLGVPAVKLDWLTAYVVGRPHLVSAAQQSGAVEAAVLAYLLGRKREWSLLEFQQQDADSALQPPVPAIGASDLVQQSWPTGACWRVPVRGRSLAAYFATLSKKSRSNVSRQMRSLMAAGELRLLSSADPATVVALFGLYQHIESQSWKVRAGAGIAQDRRSLSYYRRLLACDQPMLIVVQILLLDGVPISGLICGAFDRGLYALDIVYDERYARLAPGSATMLLAIRLAIEGGFEFLDLMRGFGYYKSRWLAEGSETRSLQIYRRGSPFHWHRRFGDGLRQWSGKVPLPDRPQFNATRREALESLDAPPAAVAPAVTADPDQRALYAHLVDSVMAGCGEFLDATQLSRLLPFPTGPGSTMPIPALAVPAAH